MAEKSIFEKIVDNEIPSWKVWEDAHYLAFLTPFPSTPGLTVVAPKKNPGSYVFAVSDESLAGLLQAAKKVAKLLEKAFGVEKVALVFEGEGVPHLHAKLYPMHDIKKALSGPQHTEFYPTYPGFISTINGPRMSDAELSALQQKIQEAAHEN